MTRTINRLAAAALLCLFASGVQAAQTGVLQLFACNYKEGKNIENLWATIDMVQSLEYSGPADEAAGSFIWLPRASGMGYDYVWGLVNSDLKSMAAGSRAYAESGNAAVMGPRFAALADCISGISTFEQFKIGNIGTTADRMPDAVVETFTCNHINGADMADVQRTTAEWTSEVAKIGSDAYEDYDAALMQPFRGTSGTWDWAWIGNSPNLESFAELSEDYLGSDAGQKLDAKFAKISRCQSSLWDGFWISTPADRM